MSIEKAEHPYLVHTFEFDTVRLRVMVPRPGDAVELHIENGTDVMRLAFPPKLAKSIGNNIAAAGETSIVGESRERRRRQAAEDAQAARDGGRERSGEEGRDG